MKPQPLSLRIKLSSLHCHRHRESWLGGQPYSWNVFFKIGGESLVILDNFRLQGGGTYHFSSGSHGNLGNDPFPIGHQRPIPAQVGEWKTVLLPLLLPHFEAPVPGVIGCISVLMEQKNLTVKGAEAGHQFLNQYIQQAIDTALSDFDPRQIEVTDLLASIKGYFTEKITTLTEGLETQMGSVIMKNQSLLENLWTLIRKDTLIGYQLWTFSHESLQEGEGDQAFSARFLVGKGGEWELNGLIERLAS